jgi:membrane associated rhomboid family serine protease
MKITPAVLLLSILNITVYLTTIIVLSIFNYDLRDDLSIYPTYSENFNLYRLLTFMFTHSTDFSHIFFNLLFLIIFGCYIEKKIGFNKFILFYVSCSLVGFIYINQGYHVLKTDLNKKFNTLGLSINKIKFVNKRVRYDCRTNLTSKQLEVIDDYNYVFSKSFGASCSVFGIIVFYFLSNLTNYRKILLSIISGYLLYDNIYGFFNSDIIYSNKFYGHFGGMFAGLLFFLLFHVLRIKKPASK